ncbi:MAG: hypothetical protein OQK49_09595 [Proteobacteria bacterium]|nr:hypothetical protein [Pseudomonadota bacterium]
MKKLLLLMILLASQVGAKELPSWGMTESQYKMPNFVSKMQQIGSQAVSNDWLLKITAPKDWHSKIRMALSHRGEKNVQINFKDSLYKSITITATPGMALKSSNSQNQQPAVAKKQVVIEKPEMDTEIEAPEFENDFKADDILADMGEIELTIPSNGNAANEPVNATKKPTSEDDAVEKIVTKEESKLPQTAQFTVENSDKEALKENLRKRYARGKAVDKSISYDHITDQDDLYVADDVVLVKRYVNRGVAVYYWMKEAYDPNQHRLTEKGSGKYVKTVDATVQTGQSRPQSLSSQESDSDIKIENPASEVFNFVAVIDNQDVQDQLRRDFIRNKAVNNTLKASQLKSEDILYVSDKTVLVERPLGNSRSAYYWLEGDTTMQKSIEHKGAQKFVIQ